MSIGSMVNDSLRYAGYEHTQQMLEEAYSILGKVVLDGDEAEARAATFLLTQFRESERYIEESR